MTKENNSLKNGLAFKPPTRLIVVAGNMFTHKYRYLFILILGLYSYLNSLFLETFRYYGIDYPNLVIALTFVVVTLFVWEGNRLIQFLFKKQILKQTGKFRPLLLSFFVSQLIALICGILCYYLLVAVVLQRGPDTRMIELKLLLLYSLRVNLFLQCLHGVVYFFDNFRQKQVEAEALKRINTQARLQAITSQVNPHFLFNNLNVLSSLVLQKKEDANTFIEAFSAVYRYILNNRDTEIVKLETELEFIEPYLYLLKTRFGDALQVRLTIDDTYKKYYLVPVALQLLIENATKHNVASVKQPLYIRLYINENEQLVIENNYQEKKEKPASTNIGLENINQRYKLLSGKEILVDKTETTFSAAIPLFRPYEIKGRPKP